MLWTPNLNRLLEFLVSKHLFDFAREQIKIHRFGENKVSFINLALDWDPTFSGSEILVVRQDNTLMLASPEEVASKVAVNAFTEIFKSCFQGFKSARGWLIERNKEHDVFGIAATRYIEKVKRRYGTIRIMGMPHPVSLNKIYTTVNILEKITGQQRKTKEDMEKTFDKDRRSFAPILRTISGVQVVNERKHFTLLGKPGAGKTTFLRHVTLLAADGLLAEPRIPILVELKQLADSELSLLDFIIEQFDICDFPEAAPFIERVLKNGSCIALLDGLDEVPREKENRILREIEQLTIKFDQNQFVISCRIAAYSYYFEKFSDVEIADFDESQTKTFIFNWFADAPNIGKDCWRQLNASIPMLELGKTPLLLTLLCLAFEENFRFPSNRADLYGDAVDALLKKWDTSRRVKRDEVYRSLSTARKETMLGEIAEKAFERNQYFFLERELTKEISAFIVNLPEVQEAQLAEDSTAVLKSIEAQHGIFVERSRGIYSFSHLTFQEFFTAKYVVENAQTGTLERLIGSHIAHFGWREVFLITAGLLPNADDFLLSLDKAVKAMAPKRVRLMLEANQDYVRNVCFEPQHPPMRPAFVRSVLIENLYISRGNAEWMRNVGRLSEKVYCLLEGHRSFQRQKNEYNVNDYDYDFITCRSRLYEPEFVVTTNEDQTALPIDNLDDYLRATVLLLDCFFTGCYVTKETKKKILDDLFVDEGIEVSR
jgi:hypothetical protein